MAEQYYTIKVGVTKPQTVETGELNKTTGLPMGPTAKADSVVGRITIPNYSKVYAKIETLPDGKLTGEFTPLKWTEPGGEVTELRYARNCRSLLKRYQEQLKLTVNEDDSEISLRYGVNYFDPGRDPMLVQMLRLHTYNGDNQSRDPENKHIIFREYDPNREDSSDLNRFSDMATAMAFLNTIKDEPRRLRVIGRALEVDTRMPDDKIILKLMQQAHGDPAAFLAKKDAHFEKVQAILYRAYDLQLIHLDEPKTVTMGEDRQVVLGGFTKMEGQKKLDFMVANAFEPDCGEAIEKISEQLAIRESQVS